MKIGFTDNERRYVYLYCHTLMQNANRDVRKHISKIGQKFKTQSQEINVKPKEVNTLKTLFTLGKDAASRNLQTMTNASALHKLLKYKQYSTARNSLIASEKMFTILLKKLEIEGKSEIEKE